MGSARSRQFGGGGVPFMGDDVRTPEGIKYHTPIILRRWGRVSRLRRHFHAAERARRWIKKCSKLLVCDCKGRKQETTLQIFFDIKFDTLPKTICVRSQHVKHPQGITYPPEQEKRSTGDLWTK